MRIKGGLKKNNWNMITIFAILLLILIVLLSFAYSKYNIEKFSSEKLLEYFYMPSCPHCLDFNPIWEELEKKISNEHIALRMQKHNLMDDDELAKKYNINAAPTIILIKDDGKIKEYNGPREVDAIISFIKNEK